MMASGYHPPAINCQTTRPIAGRTGCRSNGGALNLDIPTILISLVCSSVESEEPLHFEPLCMNFELCTWRTSKQTAQPPAPIDWRRAFINCRSVGSSLGESSLGNARLPAAHSGLNLLMTIQWIESTGLNPLISLQAVLMCARAMCGLFGCLFVRVRDLWKDLCIAELASSG